MLVQKCVLRRMTLPLLPCDCDLCDWFIHNSGYNRCFWVLAEQLDSSGSFKLTFEEIAEYEGISVMEVIKIYESAMLKLRQGSGEFTKIEESPDVSLTNLV